MYTEGIWISNCEGILRGLNRCSEIGRYTKMKGVAKFQVWVVESEESEIGVQIQKPVAVSLSVHDKQRFTKNQ